RVRRRAGVGGVATGSAGVAPGRCRRPGAATAGVAPALAAEARPGPLRGGTGRAAVWRSRTGESAGGTRVGTALGRSNASPAPAAAGIRAVLCGAASAVVGRRAGADSRT